MSSSIEIVPETLSFLKTNVLKQNGIQEHADSKYTRFVRRKFQCIIIFLILLVSFLEFLNVFIPRLNDSNLNLLNSVLYQTLNKTNSEFHKPYNSNYTIFNKLL